MGASAESTERDQPAGERNFRDADSLIVATDESGAQQQVHTADWRFHIYILKVHGYVRHVAHEGAVSFALWPHFKTSIPS